MKKNLLIWDFDGVIADTEKLWLKNRQLMLKSELGIDWDWETVNKHLRGMSDRTKQESLKKIGINTDEDFWVKSLQMDIETMNKEGFILTDGVEDIFKLNIKQCIATGGVWDKTLMKIKVAGIEKYFASEQIFTADMVRYGKPEPDLFLLAAERMGEKPENAVVIEDSLAGLMAAQKAGCLPIAFVGGDLSMDIRHIQNVKNLGIEHIFFNMSDIKSFLTKVFL